MKELKNTSVCYPTNETWFINGDLGTGHFVYEVLMNGTQTVVGISENRAELKIYNELNEDVTYLYNVNYDFGDLMVFPRFIIIETDSALKIFDNTPLTSNSYEIIYGELATNNSLEIVINGSQTNIGKSINTIDSITIYNQGADVTSNYAIDIVLGTLTVKPSLN